jgi:hypothetical protein
VRVRTSTSSSTPAATSADAPALRRSSAGDIDVLVLEVDASADDDDIVDDVERLPMRNRISPVLVVDVGGVLDVALATDNDIFAGGPVCVCACVCVCRQLNHRHAYDDETCIPDAMNTC